MVKIHWLGLLIPYSSKIFSITDPIGIKDIAHVTQHQFSCRAHDSGYLPFTMPVARFGLREIDAILHRKGFVGRLPLQRLAPRRAHYCSTVHLISTQRRLAIIPPVLIAHARSI